VSDIKQAAWLKRPEVDYPEVSKDYPHWNILGETKPCKRLNYTTVFLAILAGASLVGTLYGAGCFDRFIYRR
jgi:hypothetical protein